MRVRVGNSRKCLGNKVVRISGAKEKNTRCRTGYGSTVLWNTVHSLYSVWIEACKCTTEDSWVRNTNKTSEAVKLTQRKIYNLNIMNLTALSVLNLGKSMLCILIRSEHSLTMCWWTQSKSPTLQSWQSYCLEITLKFCQKLQYVLKFYLMSADDAISHIRLVTYIAQILQHIKKRKKSTPSFIQMSEK